MKKEKKLGWKANQKEFCEPCGSEYTGECGMCVPKTETWTISNDPNWLMTELVRRLNKSLKWITVLLVITLGVLVADVVLSMDTYRLGSFMVNGCV